MSLTDVFPLLHKLTSKITKQKRQNDFEAAVRVWEQKLQRLRHGELVQVTVALTERQDVLVNLRVT